MKEVFQIIFQCETEAKDWGLGFKTKYAWHSLDKTETSRICTVAHFTHIFDLNINIIWSHFFILNIAK